MVLYGFLTEMIQVAVTATATALSQLLWRLLSPIYSAVISNQSSWQRTPLSGVAVLLVDLKPTTQKSYLSAVHAFHAWTVRRGLRLHAVTDVDLAMFDYMQGCTRAQADILVAAMIKIYPPLRGSLHWATARAKAIHKAQPPVHHLPLPWLFAVYLAWIIAQGRQPRRAALLLLQWRFGLRPSEAIELRGSDVYAPSRLPGVIQLGYLRLGALRGTKAGRPQIARAWPADFIANQLLIMFHRATPPTARLTDVCSYRAYNLMYKAAVGAAQLPAGITPHAARAGWASARYAAGQSFPDLREDGRWRSETALRIYLDTVTATDLLETERFRAMIPFLTQLEVTLFSWLKF